MRIITLNVNGVRSASRKGVFEWLRRQKADVICLQETKAQEDQLTDPMFRPDGHHCFYFDAKKKGYAGTALYTRREPDKVIKGFGVKEFDDEGRYLEAQFGKLSVVSLYVPSGSAGPVRQASKDRFLKVFMAHLKSLRKKQREYILCADWNIVHTEKDIRNWKGNQKNSGCLPHERAWLDELYGSAGYVDAFRVVDQRDEQYTWWSNRGQAWAKNVGWRIDYQVISPGLRDKVQKAAIYKEQRFSDHAPLIMDYQL